MLSLIALCFACSANASKIDHCALLECAPDKICIEVADEAFCSCDATSCDAGRVCDQQSSECVLEDRCSAGTQWTAGTKAFQNASEKAGFDVLAAEGVRISTGDIDGDGYADLVVRRTGSVGDDPSGTRTVWLLRNRGDATFEDVTHASGLFKSRYDSASAIGRPAEIVAWADVNNNGHLDAVTMYSNLDAANLLFEGAEIMFNDGAGNFSLGPASEPLHRAGELVSRGGAAFVDVDRDGFIDLWIGHGNTSAQGATQDTLLLGDGSGRFVNKTWESGIFTQPWSSIATLNEARSHSNAWSVAACDLDGDGTAELLAASYGRAPNHLWHGTRGSNGLVLFSNQSIASGYAFDHRADWSDHAGARCYCKFNPDAAGCAGVPAPNAAECQQASDVFRWNHDQDREAFRLGGNSGTTVCADINNDGRLDLLTTEIVHWDVGSSSDPSEILYNSGEPALRFDRPGNEVTGLVRTHASARFDDGDITAAVFDFDNDGRLDILIASTDYAGTRALLYHQRADGSFEPVPINLGIDLPSAHGIAVADFDGDGDLDVVIGHSRARCDRGNTCLDKPHVRYFENVIGQGGNWVQLKLEGGPKTNRAAIGARITVRTGDLTQTHEIGGGHGHYGMQHDLVAHFGLGSACEAEVTIRWPDAELSEQSFTLRPGYRYHVVQGAVPVAGK
ncbi:MAG: CRTAC1 family protein [Bradymonadaceae bacterium]|nr:CRTAC1 family protein [Lujinxingiaceae bacterium]